MRLRSPYLLASVPAYAQSSLSLTAAAGLAARYAPTVDVGTLLAFAWFESKFRPLAIHDNTAMRSEFPASRAEAVARATALLAQNHSLDLGLCQVNSANLSHTGLTVMSAFDPGKSMRAGAQILTASLSAMPSMAIRVQPERAAGGPTLRCFRVQHRRRTDWHPERLPVGRLARRGAGRASD